MPTYRPDHISWLCDKVIKVKPRSILDLGFGFGSKGMLFREYTDVWNGDYFGWKTRIDGVEIYDKYITDLQRILYDNIYTQDIKTFVKTMGYYDLVYMGDVIEHFDKEEGLEVIKELKKRARCLIVATPKKILPQGEVYGNKYEAHKSEWFREDFEGFEVREFANTLVAVYERPGIYFNQGMSFYGVRAKELFKFNSYQIDRPCLFLGLYFAQDYKVFARHESEKAVFWNGSDVCRLLRSPNWQEWLQEIPAKHACHNKQTQEELASVGIDAKVRPIFFGEINSFKVTYFPSKKPEFYMNCHSGRESEYGLYKMLRIARRLPDIKFHVYGIDGENNENVFYHGWVEEQYMDREIRQYQGVLRFNEHDGLSQMIVKGGLLGQYIIAPQKIEGAITASDEDDIIEAIKEISNKVTASLKFSEYYLDKLNSFDWL